MLSSCSTYPHEIDFAETGLFALNKTFTGKIINKKLMINKKKPQKNNNNRLFHLLGAVCESVVFPTLTFF